MNLVSDIELPPFDYTAPDFSAGRHHQQLAKTRRLGRLTKSPLAYIVLDHDSGEFFPRSRATGGVEGIYGIDKLPIIWWGSSQLNPNRGPEPYVS
jgi:hypothetical protein